jgi:hypothetical protein
VWRICAILPGSWALANLFRVYRVMWNFAWTIDDNVRFKELGVVPDWEFSGREHFERMKNEPGGAIILTAHMGSYDLGAQLFAQISKRPIVMVRAPEIDPQTRQYESAAGDAGVAEDRLQHAREQARARSAARAATRRDHRDSGRSRDAGDLDASGHAVRPQDEQFPRVRSRCRWPRAPIYPLFIVRLGRRSYRLVVGAPFQVERTRDRAEGFARAVTQWTRELEMVVRDAWFQWYTFAPFEKHRANRRRRREARARTGRRALVAVAVPLRAVPAVRVRADEARETGARGRVAGHRPQSESDRARCCRRGRQRRWPATRPERCSRRGRCRSRCSRAFPSQSRVSRFRSSRSASAAAPRVQHPLHSFVLMSLLIAAALYFALAIVDPFRRVAVPRRSGAERNRGWNRVFVARQHRGDGGRRGRNHIRALILAFAVVAPLALIALWPYSPLAGIGVLALSHALLLYPTLRPNVQWLGPVITASRRRAGTVADDRRWAVRGHARGARLVRQARGEGDVLRQRILANARGLAREIVRRGHTLANHSHTHPQATFWCLPPGRVANEIDACSCVLTSITGEKPRWFRAPVGMKNFTVHPALQRRGMRSSAGPRADSTRSVRCARDRPPHPPHLRPARSSFCIRAAHHSLRVLEHVIVAMKERGYAFVVRRTSNSVILSRVALSSEPRRRTPADGT